jgi:hypothetical protein
MRPRDELGLMANQTQVPTRPNVLPSRLFDRRSPQHATHL